MEASAEEEVSPMKKRKRPEKGDKRSRKEDKRPDHPESVKRRRRILERTCIQSYLILTQYPNVDLDC